MTRFIMAWLILGGLTGGTAWGSSKGKGRIKFDRLSHNFGDVIRGQTVTKDFSFRNTGKGPLEIHGVHAACGCTAVELEKGRVYQPGETGTIQISLDTTDFEGKMFKTVTVVTSEKVLPDRTITVKANVNREFKVTPPLIDFGDVTVGSSLDKSFVMESGKAFKLEVKGIRYNKDLFEVEQRTSENGFEFLVQLKPQAPHGFLKETIFVTTNSKHLRELKVPIRGNLTGHIEFSPNYLEFGTVAPKEKVKRKIVMAGKKAFQIKKTRSELHINGSPIKQAGNVVSIRAADGAANKQQVAVELSNLGNTGGSVHGKIFIETDDKDQKELRVDFYAFFR